MQKQLTQDNGSPFSVYNAQVTLAGPQSLGGWDSLLEKLVFQDYRFGQPTALKSTNTVVVEYRGNKVAFTSRLVSMGKLAANDLEVDATSASRRHAVMVQCTLAVNADSSVRTILIGLQC